MKLMNKPGQVLSHVPAQREDHEERVREYVRLYNALFKTKPPSTLPSGRPLWPSHIMRKRASLQHAPSTTVLPRRARPRRGDGGFVVVRTLTGKMVPLQVPCFAALTIQQFAEAIQDKEGVPVDQQRLIFQGTQLPVESEGSEQSLQQVGIGNGSFIDLVLRLKGC